MNAKSQLIKFTAVWLIIFILCSVLSALAYSTDADAQKPSDHKEDKPAATDKDNQKDPPATQKPQDPGDDPATPPETNSPYNQLVYSAENAQHLIFVDAGHGWFDNGTSVKLTAQGEFVYEGKDEEGNFAFVTESGKIVTEDEFTYVYEKDINLQIAKKVKKALEKLGYTVGETRPSDNEADCPVELEKGVFYAKKRPAYINEQGADYMVSIHCNSFTDASVYGTRIFYSTSKDATLQLATSIMESMKSFMEDIKVGLNYDNQLYMLLYSAMPSALIETGFITNHDDLNRLQDPAWQDEFACAIALGIDAEVHG